MIDLLKQLTILSNQSSSIFESQLNLIKTVTYMLNKSLTFDGVSDNVLSKELGLYVATSSSFNLILERLSSFTEAQLSQNSLYIIKLLQFVQVTALCIHLPHSQQHLKSPSIGSQRHVSIPMCGRVLYKTTHMFGKDQELSMDSAIILNTQMFQSVEFLRTLARAV